MLKILVVDDDMVSRMVLRTILEKNQFEVVEAANAKEAIQILNDGNLIDLAIIDVMMPEVSGLQLLQYIRKSKFGYRDMPVIMCTAQKDRDSVEKAGQLKASGYIAKPIIAEKVIEHVNRVASRIEQSLDKSDEVAQRLGITPQAYTEMLSGFLDDMQQRILQLQEAINENSALKIQILANAIKGAAETLGTRGIRDAARELEEIGQSGGLQEAESALTLLSAEVTRLRKQ